MESKKQRSKLKNDRAETDASLSSERASSDDSFRSHQEKTEMMTDQLLQVGRNNADKVRNDMRNEADALLESGRSGKPHKMRKTTKETQDEIVVKDQRKVDDVALALDRSKIDSALSRERTLKGLEASAFLDHGRKQTDGHLIQERSNTDSYNQGSQDRLAAERTSHTFTKATLTTNEEFLAIVSHDLRNPIGAVLSYAELILDESDLSIHDVKSWATVIKRNAQTSLRLISDIVDLERFAEGKLHMNFAPRDIFSLVEDTVESFKNAAAERKITLSAMPSAKELWVDCDSDRIAQVLANLVGNALKFTPRGGAITIAVEQKKGDVRISVKDTGPGVPMEQQKKIFDRYTQLGNQDRRGLGLGLYISTIIVEAHRGKLGVDSAPGKGSKFYFSFPIRSGIGSPDGVETR